MDRSFQALSPLLIAYLEQEPGSGEVLGDFLEDQGRPRPPLEEGAARVDATLDLMPIEAARKAAVAMTEAAIDDAQPHWEAFDLLEIRERFPRLVDLAARLMLSSIPFAAIASRWPVLAASHAKPREAALACRQLGAYVAWRLADPTSDLSEHQGHVADQQRQIILKVLAAVKE